MAAADPALVLLSGGADSVTCLALAARRDGRPCLALTFRYGQVHDREVAAAAEASDRFGARHRVADLDPGLFAGSALTGRGEVPRGRTPGEMSRTIPATYVPARNLVFLSLGAALAESEGIGHLYLGVNALDWSGYPDCRPEFLDAFRAVLRVGTRAGVQGRPLEVHAPLLGLTKAEIFRLGAGLGVDYSRTVSCYRADPEGRACGECDACLLRARGFRAAGIPDPTPYRSGEPPL
jgi:7-cyano-7-deazaguanine synthase